MDQRQKAKLIRQTVREAGYDFWASYNDKNKNGRRLKCMRNGYDFGPKQYAKWEKTINKRLKELGVEVDSCGFERCDRPGYGDYQALVVRFQ